MKTQLKIKNNELLEKNEKHDEAILKLLKQGHRDLVVRIIKDYLLTIE